MHYGVSQDVPPLPKGNGKNSSGPLHQDWFFKQFRPKFLTSEIEPLTYSKCYAN